jgi:hypothetical protein
VFEGVQPNVRGLLSAIRDEQHVWDLAGAQGIANHLALQPNG